jgi:hydroxymethylbilane synthase
VTDVRLATRRSPLALAQAHAVRDYLAANHVTSELITTDTLGDTQRDRTLRDMGGQGVFAGAVQQLVLDGHADVAVHSAKDLPSVTPEGLELSSVPERRDPTDVVVGRALAGLGPGATIATGSPRRRALLLERRPDLCVVELRGNMDTRLAAAGRDGVDAVVTAAAALERLGWTDRIAEKLDPTWFVPQVGQGTLALETRSGDDTTRDIVAAINDASAMSALVAERGFLRELGVGCAIPAAAYATWVDGTLRLAAMMASVDGSRVLRAERTGAAPDQLGVELARHLRDERGGAVLEGWGR